MAGKTKDESTRSATQAHKGFYPPSQHHGRKKAKPKARAKVPRKRLLAGIGNPGGRPPKAAVADRLVAQNTVAKQETRVENGPQEDWERLTAHQVALISAIVLNGGNISQAAVDVGMNASYARRLCAQHPVVIETIRQWSDRMNSSLVEWSELVPRAKAKMLSLLEAEDERVQYLAAKDIIDRAEGKPLTKLDVKLRQDQPTLSEGEVTLAFSMMQQLGWSYAQAVEYIRGNPDASAEWVREHTAKLPTGEVLEGSLAEAP